MLNFIRKPLKLTHAPVIGSIPMTFTIKAHLHSAVVAIICAVSLTIMGCGAQRGRFGVTTETGCSFSTNIGGVYILQGSGSKPINTTDTDDGNLLYLVIIGPIIRVHGSASRFDSEKYLTKLDYSWETEKGELTVSIHWDRQRDIISIGKKEFSREKSNLFIVRFEPGRDAECQQLTNLDPHVACQGVLESIHGQLPNDKTISALTLFK